MQIEMMKTLNKQELNYVSAGLTVDTRPMSLLAGMLVGYSFTKAVLPQSEFTAWASAWLVGIVAYGANSWTYNQNLGNLTNVYIIEQL